MRHFFGKTGNLLKNALSVFEIFKSSVYISYMVLAYIDAFFFFLSLQIP